MTLRALMVDVDGVLVRHARAGWRWDHELEADLGIRPGALQERFFDRHWRDCVLGLAAIEERLAPVLAAIAPDVTVERLLAYWFERDAHLDEALLADLAGLRERGLRLHLATVQEHRRAEYLWTRLGLCDRFDGLHHSAAVGIAKPDPAYFAAVALRVGLAPGELLLIDDSEANVAGARAAGWQAVAWSGRSSLADLLPAPYGRA